MKNLIGFWGYPHPDVIEKYKQMLPQAVWIDLDRDYEHKDMKMLPDSYFKIIKNIFANAFYYKNKLLKIIAPIGKDKCDSGWFASELLKEYGFDVEQSVFEDFNFRKEPLISQSNLPLKQKFELITNSIITPYSEEIELCKPEFGFWGVPPNDLSILELFPDKTHVYGWTRCVDAKAPADIKLEMFIDRNIPTVFYAQAFCSKTQLAKHLAEKYNGLYIDIDDVVTNSVKAKIEAFIELR